MNARNNDKVVAKITKYPEKGKNAEGEIIEVKEDLLENIEKQIHFPFKKLRHY